MFFFLQLQHNGFNYGCLVCKTAAAQMSAGLMFRLLSAAASLLLALCTPISISRQAAISERGLMGGAEGPAVRCSLLSAFRFGAQRSRKDKSY